MKRDPVEERMAKLSVVGEDPFSSQAREALRHALGDPSFAVVARAATLVADHQIDGLLEELEQAFARYLGEGAQHDKGCQAKTAIANALCVLGAGHPEILLRGLRHVQMEPVWGGQIDVAGNLRGLCALALAAMDYPGLFYELAPLLVDPEIEARRHTVRALAATRRTEGELMLRLKALCADAEAEITGECLTGLMQMAPARSLGFVAGYLEHAQPAIRESAALAIGESHLSQGFDYLKTCYEQNLDQQVRGSLMLPMALVRSDESFGFLLAVVENGSFALASTAIRALRIYQFEDGRKEQVGRAVKRRRDKKLDRVFAEHFG